MVCIMPFSFEHNIFRGYINVNAEKTSGVEPRHIDPAGKTRLHFIRLSLIMV